MEDILKKINRFNKEKIIPYFSLIVCSTCQNNCKFCAQKSIREQNTSYQLSMKNLLKFLDCTKKSNYLIEELSIDGCGEPTLWKNFNEGILAIRDSSCIANCSFVTNGGYLKNISEEVWEYVNKVKVSIYPSFKNNKILNQLRKRYPLKIDILEYSHFRDYSVSQKLPLPIPCDCECPGPMLYDDKIFLYCATEIYDVLKIKELSLSNITTPIKENYLDNYDRSKLGNLEHCRYCPCNNNWLFKMVKL